MKWRVYHKRFTYLQKHHLMAQLVNTLDFLSSCFFDSRHKKWKSPPPPTTPSLSTTNNVITSIFITITFNMPPRPTTVWLQDDTTPSRNQQKSFSKIDSPTPTHLSARWENLNKCENISSQPTPLIRINAALKMNQCAYIYFGKTFTILFPHERAGQGDLPWKKAT